MDESRIQELEALVDQGCAREAIGDLKRLLDVAPEDARLLRATGRALNNLGRLQEAADAFRRLLEVSANDVEALASLGHVLAASNPKEAERALRRALELDPADIRALKGMQRILAGSRRLEDARAYAARVVELEPEEPDNWLNLAELLQFLDRPAEAVAALEAAVERAPERPDVHAALGRVLYSSGEVRGAEQAFAAALRFESTHMEAAAGRALCLDVMGRRHEGLAVLSPMMTRPERAGVVNYAAGRLYAGEGRYQEAHDCLRLAVGSPDPHWRRNPMPWYALGNVLEKLGRYEEAFDAWSQANRLKPAVFELEPFAERVRSIITWHSAERIASWPVDDSDLETPQPLFIVGMPRSGTTLVEQILSCHPAVQAGGERLVLEQMANQLWMEGRNVGPQDEETAETLRRRWAQSLQQLRPGSFFYTEKFPANFMHLGLARRLLPGMRVIWCRRNPPDTALSIFSNDFNRRIVPWANRLEHIAAVWKAHEELMKHWGQVLGVPILQVRYESMVGDFDHRVRELLARLGLPWEPACLRFHESSRVANTASFDQVRQPLYSTSVGRSRRYGKSLDPFVAALDS